MEREKLIITVDLCKMTGSTNIGRQLAAVRQISGLSLRDVEVRVGINRGYLWQLEQGHRLPNADQIRSLARLYRLDPHPLLKAGFVECVCRDPLVRAVLRMLGANTPLHQGGTDDEPAGIAWLTFGDGAVRRSAAIYQNNTPIVFENTFPLDDPRHALTGETVDLGDHSSLERSRRRRPRRSQAAMD